MYECSKTKRFLFSFNCKQKWHLSYFSLGFESSYWAKRYIWKQHVASIKMWTKEQWWCNFSTYWRLTEAASTSDSVHIGLPVLRHVQVYHQVDFVCIYASGSLTGRRGQSLTLRRDKDKNTADGWHMESSTMEDVCVHVSPGQWRWAPCIDTASVSTSPPVSGPESDHLYRWSHTVALNQITWTEVKSAKTDSSTKRMFVLSFAKRETSRSFVIN